MAPGKGVCLLEEFAAHGATVTCVSLGSKSGRVMATGSDDKKVNLWAVGKPKCIVSLTGHTTALESVRFGPNEDLVCAGASSGALKIWDLDAAKILRTFVGHKAAIKSLDFHPYGDFLAASDSAIKLWDIRKKGCIYTYKGHAKSIQCLRFSPDGRWLVSGGDEGIVKLWDLPAGKLLAELKDHSGPVTDVAFHPNELLLSTSSLDGSIKFWDLETFQLVSSTSNDLGSVLKIIFDPEGKVLLSAPKDLLKVTTWEPTRVLDSVTVGWGKIKDMTITSSHQLVAAATCLTNVSVHVVDLNNLKPFSSSNPSLLMRQSSSSSTSSAFNGGERRRLSSSGRKLGESSAQLSASLSSLFFTPTGLSMSGYNNLNGNKLVGGLNYDVPGSASSSSSLFGMRSVESLSSSIVPTTASLNKLCIRPTPPPRPVVAIEQQVEVQQQQPAQGSLKGFSGHWNNNLTPSASSSHLFHHSNNSHLHKNSSNNKSLEVLPPLFQPHQVQIFLSQKQQLHLQHLEQQKVVRNESKPGNDSSFSSPSKGTAMKEQPISAIVASRGRGGSTSSLLSSPNLAATNNITNKSNTFATNQGNNNGSNSSSTMKSSPLPSPTSSPPSLSKSKSQVSLVKPVLISNGPSINSSGHQLQTSSSSANLASGSRNQSMVRSLPLRTAPVQPTIPSQRVQPQTSHQVPILKTAAVVFPTEQHHRKTCQPATVTLVPPLLKQLDDSPSHQVLIPETRDHPAGLDIDEFLPKHLQNVARLGITQPEVSEPEAMTEMIRGHRSVVTALAHRKKNIQIVLAVWSSKDPMKALDQAIQLEDESVLVDILNVIILKPSFWTLDLCQMLLPSIQDLLQSKYESYMSVGCTSLKLILKNFSTMITSNITAPPGIGVDISREERYNKCMSCYKNLLSVRAFLLKRQTLQGKLGRSFRELSILMQSLE